MNMSTMAQLLSKRNEAIDFGKETFYVRDCIGQGKCCQVYSCDTTFTEKEVALKIFYPEKKFDGAFLREVSILFNDLYRENSKLVTPIANFDHNKSKCIVYEKLEESLAEIIANPNFKMSKTLIFTLAKNLAEGLIELHTKGYIHGDLKMANVMWSSDSNCFKIIDFGLSFHHTEKLGHKIQSQSYKAPETRLYELTLGEDSSMNIAQPSFDCDIWSYGCLLLHAVRGAKVFRHELLLCECEDDESKCPIQVHLIEVLQGIGEEELEMKALKKLILECLRCKKRLNSLEVLNHEYFQLYAVKKSILTSFDKNLKCKVLCVTEYFNQNELKLSSECKKRLYEITALFSKNGNIKDSYILEEKNIGHIILVFDKVATGFNLARKFNGTEVNGRTLNLQFYLNPMRFSNYCRIDSMKPFIYDEDVALLHGLCSSYFEKISISHLPEDSVMEAANYIFLGIHRILERNDDKKDINHRLHEISFYQFSRKFVHESYQCSYFESISFDFPYLADVYLLLLVFMDWDQHLSTILQKEGMQFTASFVDISTQFIRKSNFPTSHKLRLSTCLLSSLTENILNLSSALFPFKTYNETCVLFEDCISNLENDENCFKNFSVIQSFISNGIIIFFNASYKKCELFMEFSKNKHHHSIITQFFEMASKTMKSIIGFYFKNNSYKNYSSNAEWHRLNFLLNHCCESYFKEMKDLKLRECFVLFQQNILNFCSKLPTTSHIDLMELKIKFFKDIVNRRIINYNECLDVIIKLFEEKNSPALLLDYSEENYSILNGHNLINICLALCIFDHYKIRLYKLIRTTMKSFGLKEKLKFIKDFQENFEYHETCLTLESFHQDLIQFFNQSMVADFISNEQVLLELMMLSLQNAELVFAECFKLAFDNSKITKNICVFISYYMDAQRKDIVIECFIEIVLNSSNVDGRKMTILTCLLEIFDKNPDVCEESLVLTILVKLIIPVFENQESEIEMKLISALILEETVKNVPDFESKQLKNFLLLSLVKFNIYQYDYACNIVELRSTLLRILKLLDICQSASVQETPTAMVLRVSRYVNDSVKNASKVSKYETFVLLLSKVLPHFCAEEWVELCTELQSFELLPIIMEHSKIHSNQNMALYGAMIDVLIILLSQSKLSKRALDYCVLCLLEITKEYRKRIASSQKLKYGIDSLFILSELFRLNQYLVMYSMKSNIFDLFIKDVEIELSSNNLLQSTITG